MGYVEIWEYRADRKIDFSLVQVLPMTVPLASIVDLHKVSEDVKNVRTYSFLLTNVRGHGCLAQLSTNSADHVIFLIIDFDRNLKLN